MKPRLMILLTAVSLVLLPIVAAAQVDAFGTVDTLYAELNRIDKTNWTVTISYVNDEWVDALSLPFALRAGDTKLVSDSAIYTGGRVAHFDFKGFRADSAIQCFTLGLMANMGPSQNGLPPGSGRLATVFVSSLDGTPIEKLTLDTTTTHPSNSLMVMAQGVQPGNPPDTIPGDRFDDLTIIPVLIIKQVE